MQYLVDQREHSMTRYSALDRAGLEGRQAEVFDAILAGPRAAVLAPHHLLLRSPELADHSQKMGAFLRYGTRLGPRLSELVILLTARHWCCAYEWDHHEPIARRDRVADAIIAAIALGQTPAFQNEDEQQVHDVCMACLQAKQVSDPCFLALTRRFGEAGLIEVIGLVGYYSMLAMMLNAFETPGEGGAQYAIAPRIED
jgi:4-carboxymuconolactone decarboxylase